MRQEQVLMKIFLALIGIFLSVGPLYAEVTLDQVVSRESPLFRCQFARMTVGRDGFMYLTSENQGKGYCLRLSRDGKQKLGGEVIYAIHNGTANAAGVIATANAHFNHSINLYESNFQKRVTADDFLVNDQVGWDAPCHVEAGASGEFYGLDQHRNRVIRVGTDGKVKSVYPMRAAQETDWGLPNDFRVSESLQSFYWLANGHLIRTRFDGSTAWKVAIPVQYRWDVGSHGGLDIDEAGQVYLIEGAGDVVKRLDLDGQPLPPIKLEMGDLKPTAAASITGLRIWDNDLIVRRASQTELFQVYDRTTGLRKNAVSIDYERLTVTFPSTVWTNGEKIPLSIKFQGPSVGASPRFRVWLTPFGISDWRELSRDSESMITVPENGAGLYQLKVSPEVLPRQTDEPSEYLVHEVVEIRKPGSLGTIAVVTPLNRTHYSTAGEVIRGRVVARTKRMIERVDVRLRNLASGQVLASQTIDLKEPATADGSRFGEFQFTPLSRDIEAVGEHQLDVDVPELTCVPQRLVLGHGMTEPSDFRTTLYGDYGLTCPQRNAWEAADSAIVHSDRMRKLGVNQFVNRTQQLALDFANDDNGRGLLNRVKERLQSDPMSVTPEKAEFGSAHHFIAGTYSANGWREFLILISMDGGLPIGTGFDRRTPMQFAETIQRFTEAFWSYRGFTGWAWVANWWVFDANGRFTSTDEKPRYDAALKTALDTGRWDPILDQVDDRKYGYAVDAQAQFNHVLREHRQRMVERFPGTERLLTTATAGPYRRPEVLPELNFANVDEIDVHYQAEQITTPDWVPHAIDVSKRLQQPIWIHPELWNDFGTGEQILPLSWLALMRGANGVGTSGNIPNWSGVKMDSRLGYHGTTTVFRSLNRAIRELAAPLKLIAHQMVSDQDGDRVGIVVSPRQLKIETFGIGIGSVTFSRQFEAYQSFLYASCPARFVSLEEVKTRFADEKSTQDLARRFDLLLLVGQNVELEPEWQSLLTRAKGAGVKVLADGTCRPGIFPDAEPLGVKFDAIENEHSVNIDHAHSVYPARFIHNSQKLATTVETLKASSRRPHDVATLIEATAGGSEATQRPVVILQEYETSEGRLVFVINNTPPLLPPGQLRKVGLAISTRMPVVAQVKFNVSPGQQVVDMFTQQPVNPEVAVDLRDAYARLYRVAKRDPEVSQPQSAPTFRFGPHLRDVAVSADGSTALLNAFNWDDNLYGVDLDNGTIQFRKRVADHFAYAPRVASSGFAVQGYDLKSAEGYHLYLLDHKGRLERRFALPAVPGCLTGWAFTAWIQDQINNFAVPVTGSWIAASRNLGLAVWERSGKLLWSEDWSQTKRQSLSVESLGDETLITASGMTVAARQAATGAEIWNVTLANAGGVVGLHPARDGKTLAVRTDASGGRVFVIRDGHVIGNFSTPADDLSLSSDGGVIAVTTGHHVKVFAVSAANEGEQPSLCMAWLAHGDDQLRFPRVSGDGKRIAVCSELGTLYVFSSDGEKLHERDEFGIVVPTWLPNGDLLIASWTGAVKRIGTDYQDRWCTHVRDVENLPKVTVVAGGDRVPAPQTSRITSWANAKTTIPERRNLLAPNQFVVQWLMGTTAVAPAHPVNELADGNFVTEEAALPSERNQKGEHQQREPWLGWAEHGMIESGWRGEFSLVVDSFNKQLRIDAITFVEDANHSESWLRDMRLEFWDADAERWVFADYLTSDSVIHSHRLKQPIETARIRFVKADGHAWPAGNVRLQELMLHGESLGASHPDVVAKRSVAVLFDENVASVKPSYEHGHNAGLRFTTGPDAFSGGNYITITGDRKFAAAWQPPFGHMTPNWWFEVVEKPVSGQYRYLQFSVKGLTPETKGITLQLAPAHYGGVAIHLGEVTNFEGVVNYQSSASVPYAWHTVTVDLWQLLPENQRNKPFNIGAMSLGAVGGPAAVDKIRLGRTSEDLQK